MKRITASLSALLVLSALFTLTSCQKEDTSNAPQFRATMEDCTSQNGKTTLSGTNLNWVGGDRIAVYGTAGRGIYSATPQTPATTAIFDNVSGETGDGPFRAFYPASLTTDGVNITLPATQTYVENSIHEFPMYAESSNNQLAFKNLCGVLKLHLFKMNTNVTAITVTSTDAINGTFSVNYNSVPEIAYTSNGTNSTTLTCAVPQSINNGKDFYIYLPSGSYSGIQIKIVTDDGHYCIKTAKRAINVNRSQYTSISFSENDMSLRPIGSKGGLFTINDAGDQVWFSQGNLQYQASSNTWRFAENQYDYVGNATVGNVYENGVKCSNTLISDTYNGWIDLFGWGTWNNPTLHEANNINFTTWSNDWGHNAISNGGNTADTWRTLSIDEWAYLLNRVNSNYDYLVTNGTVNGVHGAIILPDDWIIPDNVNNFTWGWDYPDLYHWSIYNNFTLDEWEAMEASGAVFLPITGIRNYSSNISNVGEGRYWSSTAYSDGNRPTGGKYVGIYPYGIATSSPYGEYGYYGYAVRLVQNANQNF